MEKVEKALEIETARLLSVAGENQKLANLAHNRWTRLCVEEKGAIESWAMLDVMAKAWERANDRYQREYDFATRILGEKWKLVDELCIAKIAIERYRNAWSKGQEEPDVDGVCVK